MHWTRRPKNYKTTSCVNRSCVISFMFLLLTLGEIVMLMFIKTQPTVQVEE